MSEETFDAGWLALRESVDHRSRAHALLPRLTDWWGSGGRTRVLDLGCGTGSNLRYLAPRLPEGQEWTLLDHDADLLGRIEAPAAHVKIGSVRGDLAVEGLAEVNRAHLVTASALLDLVSDAWLTSLAVACSAVGCGVLFALTYDGTIEWAASDPDDELVHRAVNAHQRRTKGLGPALGPAAGSTAEHRFREQGYRTWLLPSPWQLTPSDAELALALLEGWAGAAVEERPDAQRDVQAWMERRTASIGQRQLDLRVGHVDLLALPTDRKPVST